MQCGLEAIFDPPKKRTFFANFSPKIMPTLTPLEGDLRRITRSYQTNKITPEQWRSQFAATLRLGHLQAARDVTGSNQYDWVADMVLREELGYLDGFYSDVASGILDGDRYWKARKMAMGVRSLMYADAIALTRSYAQYQQKIDLGFRYVWRRLNPRSEHCKHCPGYATKGYVPIRSVIVPGFRCQCRSRCNCRLIFKR
jgi:hypothetical protein